MSFQPVLPSGGFAGWRFLERTLDRQMEIHANAPTAKREEAYFRERIGQVTSASDLVADRRLLKVALTAFGLLDDLPNRAFIERVLESPTSERRSFATRLGDRRYAAMAEAFGFGETTPPRTQQPGFADRIIGLHQGRSFEEAVGAQDDSMRLALALRRDLTDVAARDNSEEAKWLTILGTPNLRTVFETAFRLPNGFGALDLDRQIDVMRDRTRRAFGDASVSQFADPQQLERLTQRYFLSEQVNFGATLSSGSTALMLLQGGQVQPLRSI